MSNVEEIAALVGEAVEKMNAAVTSLEQAQTGLGEYGPDLASATEGTNAHEIDQATGLAAEAAGDIGTLIGQLNGKTAELGKYRTSLTGPPPAPPDGSAPAPDTTTTPATSSTPATAPDEPANVKAARAQLPPPVVKNSGFKTHGQWSADGADDAAAIVSGKKDDMYAATAAHLATLGMGNLAIASHVETKLAVHMATAGLTNVTVTINNTPCAGPLGCDTMLPVVLPDGATLTVYGTNEDGTPAVNTYTGRRSR